MSDDGNGNGSGIDPKWYSYVDKTVRETLESLGQKVGSLKLDEEERQHAELATARALIYAGCTIVWGIAEEDAATARAFVDESVNCFFGGLDESKD